MGKDFTLAKVTKLGDMDEKFGQRYWAETSEQLEPVMFNSMNQEIKTGDKITAEEVLLKTSAKGVEYHGLKKVKVVGGGQTTTTSSMSEAQINELLELAKETNKLVKQLTGSITEDELSELPDGF